MADGEKYRRFWETLRSRNEVKGEFVNRRKNGEIIHIDGTASPILDEQQQIIGYLGVQRDITARKKAEEALTRSERLLRESQEIARIGCFVIDIATGSWESSLMLNTIFGIGEGTAHTGDEWDRLIAEPYRQRTLDHYHAALRDHGQYHIDYQIVRPSDGVTRWVSAIGALDYDAAGSPIRMIGTVQDITDRKHLEGQLIQSQKLEGIGTLAGGIAHDFNNLLALILGSAELLELQVADRPEMKKYVDRIIEASERGTSISRQLLLFSRPEQAALKPVVLAHAVRELEGMLTHFLPKSTVLTTVIEAEDGVILGDAGQIHQALLNLSLNAGDAMTQTGALTIREYIVDGRTMAQRFASAQATDYAAVAVSDTGTGMDQALLAKIFDPFFTTKAEGKGTGLGLGIVHGIVKNHHGIIDVHSVLGEGTTFTLYFPLISPGDAPEHDLRPGTVSEQGGTILVVDDEDLLREMLLEYLTDAGYSVHTASTGREALEIFQTHAAEIDLVITDLGMPEMGGEELYRRLELITPGVKVMVSSGYLDGITKEHFLKSGIRDVLTKPYKLLEIHKAIRAVLHEPSAVSTASERA